jgi:hypothetical protein
LAKVLYSHDLNFFTDGLFVKLKLGSDKRRIGQNEALVQMSALGGEADTPRDCGLRQFEPIVGILDEGHFREARRIERAIRIAIPRFGRQVSGHMVKPLTRDISH